MYIVADTLDDLLRKILAPLLRRRSAVHASRGRTREIPGALLRLRNPLARLSRTESRGILVSSLGELLWYLSGTNQLEFIRYYIPRYADESDDGVTVWGGYGTRLHAPGQRSQLLRVIELLRQRPTTRRAVIQIFEASDTEAPHRDVPCTCTLQYLVRDGYLHGFAHMRSNDAYIGFPHDVFAFTMLQEIVARSIGVSLGTYTHSVTSLHLYRDKEEDARRFLSEGWQSKVAMPPMPTEPPWQALEALLDYEARVRKDPDAPAAGLVQWPYWADLGRILRVYSLVKHDRKMEIRQVERHMESKIYAQYIRKRAEDVNVQRISELPLNEGAATAVSDERTTAGPR